ncbi:MAG: phage terminase small subunit P27 family [Planctomycetota bacterium]
MGTRGPIPMSETVARQLGTYRKDRHQKTTLRCAKGSAKMPERMGGDERVRAVWEEIAPGLIERGLLTVLDEAAFRRYCWAEATHRTAAEHLATEGWVITNSRGRKIINPWVRIESSAMSVLLKLAQEFGMTPVSRARLGPVMIPEQPVRTDKSRFFERRE